MVKDEAARPLTDGNAVTAVKQLILDPPLTHDKTTSVYDHHSQQRDRM